MRAREFVASLLVMLAGSVVGALLGWLEFDGVDLDV